MMESTSDENKDTILNNTIEKLSSPSVYLFISCLIITFTVIGMIILFSGKTGIQWSNIDVFFKQHFNVRTFEVVMISLLLVFIIGIILLLYTKTFSALFQIIDKLGWVFLLMIFIIGLVIFYYQMKPEVLKKYQYIILAIVCTIAAKLFYNALQQSEEETYRPNLQVEKIRFSLVYFAFVVFIFFMFFNDIGGIKTHFMGPSLILTMVLLAIGLVYLLNLLTFPIYSKDSDSTKSLTSGYSWFSIIHIGLFLITIITFIVGFFVNKDHFKDKNGVVSFKNSNFAVLSIIFGFILSLWIGFFLVRTTKNPVDVLNQTEQNKLNGIGNIAQQAINIVLGIALIATLATWIYYLVEQYDSDSDLIPLLLNIGIIVVILYFSYKYLSNSTQFEKSPYYRLIINLIFYIPCILYNIVEWFFSVFGIKIPTLDELVGNVKGVKDVNFGTRNDIIMLLIIIFLNILYFIIFPYTVNKISKQGGNVLQLQPVPISSPRTLGTYLELNGIDSKILPFADATGVHNYNYAVSFWVYLNSSTTAEGADKYFTVMNYTDVPHVKWNPKKAELTFSITPKENITPGEVKYPEELDENGNLIVYKTTDFKTQRWNNIIVNFSGGTFDIFINSKLVKSKRDAVPKIEYGSLNMGSYGLSGSLCNIIYFNFSLTMNKVHYLYNLVKNNDPPIPVNTTLGATENAVYNAFHKKKKTVLPIDVELDIFDKIETDKEDEQIDSINVPSTKNYLSLHWYFKQNKDGGNSINSGGPDQNTCKYPTPKTITDEPPIPKIKTPEQEQEQLSLKKMS